MSDRREVDSTISLSPPTRPLRSLDREPEPEQVARAVQARLNHLDQDRPHLLTCRFGPKEAGTMRLGMEELPALASWAFESGLPLRLTPIRWYTSAFGEEVLQVIQEVFASST